jgi:hypothetical protein
MMDANSHKPIESSEKPPHLPIPPPADEELDEPLEIVFAENVKLEKTSPAAPEAANAATLAPPP